MAAADFEDITASWLSDVLRRDVRAITGERVGSGVTAATYRLQIETADGPTTLVAKVAVGDEAARTRVAPGYQAEVGFYDQLVDTLDVRAPHCWYAAISPDALRFTLLLEDLAPRVPGVQAAGCSIADARLAVRNLAGLHVPRWSDPALLDLPFGQPPTPERAAFVSGLAKPATDVFVERYGDELGQADCDVLIAAAAATERWFLTRPEPFAVVHGDYRLDNLMFAPDGSDVVAVDWQTLAVGPPMRDLAYFLATSLSIEQRREAQRDLVAEYHAALLARGRTDYSARQCYEDYRLAQLQAPMITTIGAAFATAAPTPESDAMFLSMARRACAAIQDLGSLDLV